MTASPANGSGATDHPAGSGHLKAPRCIRPARANTPGCVEWQACRETRYSICLPAELYRKPPRGPVSHGPRASLRDAGYARTRQPGCRSDSHLTSSPGASSGCAIVRSMLRGLSSPNRPSRQVLKPGGSSYQASASDSSGMRDDGMVMFVTVNVRIERLHAAFCVRSAQITGQAIG